MVGSMQTPIIPVGSGQTQELIAPVQDTLIAKQNYAEGQQFILGGALFTVTKSGGISVGNTINMNTDVESSDNITDQIKNLDTGLEVEKGTVVTSSDGLITVTFAHTFRTIPVIVINFVSSSGTAYIPAFLKLSFYIFLISNILPL